MWSFTKIGPLVFALSYADGQADSLRVLVAIRSANTTKKKEQKATSDIMTTWHLTYINLFSSYEWVQIQEGLTGYDGFDNLTSFYG
jgi:hypothetical protein